MRANERLGIVMVVGAMIVGTIGWQEYVNRPVETIAELRCGDKLLRLRTNVFGDTLMPGKCDEALYVVKLYDQAGCGAHWWGLRRMPKFMQDGCFLRDPNDMIQNTEAEQPQLVSGPNSHREIKFKGQQDLKANAVGMELR